MIDVRHKGTLTQPEVLHALPLLGLDAHHQFADNSDGRHRFEACFELCDQEKRGALGLDEFLLLLSLLAPDDDPVRAQPTGQKRERSAARSSILPQGLLRYCSELAQAGRCTIEAQELLRYCSELAQAGRCTIEAHESARPRCAPPLHLPLYSPPLHCRVSARVSP